MVAHVEGHTELTWTAHTNSYTGHALLLSPSTPKVMARVQPSLFDCRTTLSRTWAFPARPDRVAVIRTRPGGRLMDAATAHLLPSPSLVPSTPCASVPAPSSAVATPTRSGTLGGLRAVPLSGCLHLRWVSASLTRCALGARMVPGHMSPLVPLTRARVSQLQP